MCTGICVCVFNVSVFLTKKLNCELLHRIAKTKTVKSRLTNREEDLNVENENSNFYITKWNNNISSVPQLSQYNVVCYLENITTILTLIFKVLLQLLM